jgi:glucokinase
MDYVGIEIGGTKLQLVLGDGAGRIRERRRLAVDAAEGGEGIRRQISGALPGLLAAGSVRAVGVGFGGPVDWRTGRVCCSHQVKGWHDFPLGEWLATETGLPVHVDNDANVAAFGEALHGAGKGMDPVFWINMGSGVGGGMVVGGAIYHGQRPGECEVGHLRLDKSGVTVEDRCSGWAVDARLREVARHHPEGPLGRRVAGMTGGEARHWAAALAEGDAGAQAVLSELADNLGFALSHVVQLLHPEVVVVGGGLSLVGEPLRAAMAEALRRYVMDAFQPGPEVRLAGMGEDSVPVGALALAASAIPRG